MGTLTAVANGAFAILDFVRSPFVLENMSRVRVKTSWLYPLGLLKLAGAIGLLIGIAVPALGVAAAVGLVLFFVGAIVTHIRAREYSTIPYPGTLLVAATACLLLRAASI